MSVLDCRPKSSRRRSGHRDQAAWSRDARNVSQENLKHAAARYDRGSEFHTRCRFETSAEAARTTDPPDDGVVFSRLLRGRYGHGTRQLAISHCDVGVVHNLAVDRLSGICEIVISI